MIMPTWWRRRRRCSNSLGIKQLRLLMGTSMGCMMGFQFGIDYPRHGAGDHAAGVQHRADSPGATGMWRAMAIDAIKADPDWQGGNYTKPPDQRPEGRRRAAGHGQFGAAAHAGAMADPRCRRCRRGDG